MNIAVQLNEVLAIPELAGVGGAVDILHDHPVRLEQPDCIEAELPLQ